MKRDFRIESTSLCQILKSVIPFGGKKDKQRPSPPADKHMEILRLVSDRATFAGPRRLVQAASLCFVAPGGLALTRVPASQVNLRSFLRPGLQSSPLGG